MLQIDVQDQILDKLNTLTVVLNNDGSIYYVSKIAQQLLGFNPDDLISYNWWEVARFTKPEGEEVKHKILRAFKNNNISNQNFEHTIKTKNGGTKYIRWDISFLNEDQLIAVGSDITDNKLKEKRLLESNKQLLEQNKSITDSIYYAQRIQESILQTPKQLNHFFENSFLLYKPKDIVSGDYYWFYETDDYKFIAAVDCTGHGVPGAMMSMLANSLFKEVFINKKIMQPNDILKALDIALDEAINKQEGASFNDGMDVALIRIDKVTNHLVFAGAFRSIIIERNMEIIELKGNRYPIGFFSGIEKKFENIEFQLQNNDSDYLFTDGYIDQFGGSKNKKLNKSNFKDLLKTVVEMDMEEKEAFLEYSLNNWKQDNEQTDDVLVIGIKI